MKIDRAQQRAESAAQSPPRLLIVDDEIANVNALRDTLRGQGYEVEGFTEADAALAALREGAFDLLLADLVMPGKGGVELLREAQAIDPDLVGVIMTGDGAIATAVEAMQTGALDYILKPLKLSVILPVLSRALTVRRLRAENASLERRVRARTVELESALKDVEAQTAERNKAEQALREAQKMEALGKLAGGIAHDFNNLLTVVVGALDMMRRAPGDTDRVVRLSGRAMMAVERCEALIKQMLVFARRQVMHPRTVDLNQLIGEFEPLVRHAVGANIELTINLEPGPKLTRIDRQQFEAALLNLVMNARDAILGEGRITIETRDADDAANVAEEDQDVAPAGHLAVTVSDSGAGIAPDVLPRVFDPFFTTKAVGSGTGLGLSQVYGFTTHSGGRVDIVSEAGVGTTVSLYLPRSLEAEVEVEPETAAAAPASGARRSGTVLVVEDEEAVLTMAVECLGGLGYRVLTAQNAAEALGVIAADESIDILFSDIVMPGAMNGVQLAGEARRLRPKIRVLLTSGYTADALSSHHGLGRGVPLLPKPYLPTQLAERLGAVAQ